MASKRFGLASPSTTKKRLHQQKSFAISIPPFIYLKKRKTYFWCSGFQSFRNSPIEGGLYCSQLRSTADLHVKDALEDFGLTAATTINQNQPLQTAQRSINSYCKPASSVPASSILRMAEYLYVRIFYFGWKIFVIQTERQTLPFPFGVLRLGFPCPCVQFSHNLFWENRFYYNMGGIKFAAMWRALKS